MNSFYVQQSPNQTLFSASHFVNQSANSSTGMGTAFWGTPQMQSQLFFVAPSPVSTVRYANIPCFTNNPPQAFATRRPVSRPPRVMASLKTHQVSKPPMPQNERVSAAPTPVAAVAPDMEKVEQKNAQQPQVVFEETLAFPEEPRDIPQHLRPLEMKRELYSGDFLTEPQKPKKQNETAPEPPKLQRNLSDLSDAGFLLENGTKEKVLDEWAFDEHDEPPAFERKRSNSAESGSARSTSAPAPEVIKPVPESPALGEPKSVWEQRQLCDLKSSLAQKTRAVSRKTRVAPRRQQTPAPQQQTVVRQPRPAPRERPVVKESSDKWIGTVKRKKKNKSVQERFPPNSEHETRRPVTATLKKTTPTTQRKKRGRRDPNEVWTFRKGTFVTIIGTEGRFAYIEARVYYWAPHQDRSREQPFEKLVEGWISLKDSKGWVL